MSKEEGIRLPLRATEFTIKPQCKDYISKINIHQNAILIHRRNFHLISYAYRFP